MSAVNEREAPGAPFPAAGLADRLRVLMAGMVDKGTDIDTGHGMGSADLWLTIGGTGYRITVSVEP